MTHPKLRKEESDVLKNLLSGMSASAVARKLGLHRSKVKNIIDRLVYYGRIRAVPGTKNPVIYEDPYNVIPFPPTGGTPKETDHTPSVSESTAPPDNSSHGYKVDMNLVKGTGISTDKECPPGYVEAHMTGCIRMQIVSIGRFDTLRDPAGFTIGYWNDPKPIRGNTVYGGEIRIFNQSITWQYREGNKGSRTFMLYPSRIFLDPKQFKTEEEAKDVFIDRANFVASLFAAQGWKLVNPQIRGHFEYAIRDHPLVGLIPHDVSIPSGSDIEIDTSKGVPEAEMKDIDDWEKVKIWANVPSEVLRLNRKVQSQDDTIVRLDATLRSSIEQIAVLEATVEGLTRLIEKQNIMLTGLVDASSKLAQIGSNLVTAQSQSDVIGINALSRGMSDLVQTDAKTDGRKKDPFWEGYI